MKLLLACGSMKIARWPVRLASWQMWLIMRDHRRKVTRGFAGLAKTARESGRTGPLTEIPPAKLTRLYFQHRSLAGIAPVLCVENNTRFQESMVVTENFSALSEAAWAGRGLVVASTHMGAMGIATALITQENIPVIILRDEHFRVLEGTRHGKRFFLGARPIFLEGGDPTSVSKALLTCARHLRNGGVVCYTVDGGHGNRYYEGKVFNRTVELRTGLVELAIRCGSPVVSVFSHIQQDHVHVRVSDAEMLTTKEDMARWCRTFCADWENAYLNQPTAVTWVDTDRKLASHPHPEEFTCP